ncbi:MAG: rhomboid family intramembrane serine protease [Bacilli bacterium]|nr:rhomboid family intramembrane serine protease [Bacilli bacterium]
MTTLKISEKDDMILKILHYFITKEDYKPVIINGVENEIWLENFENDVKLIRININYIHNEEQLNYDYFKVKSIMKSIKKNTLSFKMNVINLLLDTGENVKIKANKNIETIKVNKVTDIKKNKTMQDLFPNIKTAEFTDKTDVLEFFKLTEDMNETTMKNEKKLAKIFSPKKPIITYSLIIINTLIFLLSLFNIVNIDDMYMMFGANYELVASGEFYRLFTCMFFHADLLHLIFNMYALYILGTRVERYYGSKRYIVLYLISGLVASLFSCVFNNINVISIGASGAIFGLFGSIAYFTYHYRGTLREFLTSGIIPTLLLNLIIGFANTGIDMAAHIGGIIGGLLIAMSIGIGDKTRKNDNINGIIVLLLMIAFLIYMVMIK